MPAGLTTELLELSEAVEREVSDGDCVWIGNFGAQLFAVGAELIRQRRRDLHVVMASGGILLDRLIAAGVLGRVTFAHCWSPVGPHPTRAFRAAWERGSTIEWCELSLGALSAALGAGAAGVPFASVAVDPATGYPEWGEGMLARVQTPFGEAHVVRGLRPDVGFIHTARADPWGNCALGAPAGEAVAAAGAARRTIAVAEQMCPTDELGGLGITIPGVLVDGLVVHPGAVAPDGVAGLYPRDVRAYAAYLAGTAGA